MLSDAEYDALLRATESARTSYFSSLGDLDGNWQPIINPRFADGPTWPTRPGWQRIIARPTTMVASSGLADPWLESEAPNNGFGIETVVATNDDLPSDLMQMVGTWLYQFSVAVANAAAADRRFALRHDKFGIFLFGVPHEGIDAPNEWVCHDGCFGFLVGIPIPQQTITFTVPGGDVHLLTAKLLTPAEYSFVADEGIDGAHRLRDLFVSDGSHHLSSICRQSVI